MLALSGRKKSDDAMKEGEGESIKSKIVREFSREGSF